MSQKPVLSPTELLELRKEVEYLYTPLEHALVELERRRRDTELTAQVAKFFEKSAPLPELAEEPRMVMARALFSPVLELLYLLDLKEHLSLKTVFYEFTNDKFVASNPTKYSLGKMNFFEDEGRGKLKFVGSEMVVDFHMSEGKKISDVTTVKGENLVEFHHRLLDSYVGPGKMEIVDFSHWFRNSRVFHPTMHYLRYLGLFLTNGILFENFLLDKWEHDFTLTEVIPAFKELENVFGVKPLIVPVAPREADEEAFWSFYPAKIKHFL